MKNKIKILLFCDWFVPAYKAGGPIRSIHNLVLRLGKEYEIYLFTSNKDIDGSPLEHIEENRWIDFEEIKVFYCNKNTFNKPLSEVIKNLEPNFVYLNSLFSFNFSIKIIVLRWLGFFHTKILLAPRGELSKGALAIKTFKKRVYLSVSKILGFYSNVSWHYTSQGESNDLERVFGSKIKKKSASNIPTNITQGIQNSRKKQRGNLKIIFFSRISKMKNTAFVFEVLKLIQAKNCKVELAIYGTIEDKSYWEECLKIANDLPSEIEWNYKGKLSPEYVPKTLSQYHLFFLPTKGENFGHAIVEALQCGCPILISDRTPWRDLENQNVGWDLDLKSTKAFVLAIQQALNWDDMEYKERVENAIIFSRNIVNDPKIILDYKRLFSLS